MNETVKAFMDAVKETPRLYFAPIVAALNAVSHVESEMTRTYRGTVRARTFDSVDHAHPLRSKKAAAAKPAVKMAKKVILKKKRR
ncbi:hypothetical protein [Burkholderia seminalis]|uniref:hypothetical protein n=1 Tax=Burkholderia seminalis TaxID=488731 RepID=UPI00114D09C7|nr:hypothetical protein [Burkholderia seminalis]